VDKQTEALQGDGVAVSDRHNIAHKGTIVTYGRAVGLVIATGMRTELGRVATLLQEAHSSRTPLQRRFAAFGRSLSLVVLVICAVVFSTGLLR
jgi:Ca2+-transporting ATPase